jgi:hypothetical protein
MAFQTPNPYNTLASRNRNDLLAKREQLLAQEARLARQIDQLRSQQDDLSNQLMQPNPTLADVRSMMDEERAQRPMNPSEFAKFVIEAGERARGKVPPPLPPRGSVARFVVLAGMKARNEKITDDE